MRQIQRRSAQLQASAEVSRIASTILDSYELLPRVVELIREGFNLYYAGLFLVDQNGEWTGEANKWAVLRAGSGDAGQQMITAGHKLEIGGDSMIGTAINNAEARIALDVGEEARFFRNPYLPNTRSEMALPLISRGEVLGALTIQSEQEAAFSQEDITALQTMADQVANTIENARLFEQSESRAEELNVLNEMARAFTQTMDIQILVEQTHHFVNRLINASNFYLAFYYPESNEIEFKVFIDEDPESPVPDTDTRMELGGGITDWIITNKQPLLLKGDVTKQMEELEIPVRGSTSVAYLGVPMLAGNRIIGTIAVQSYDNPHQFSNHHLDLLSAIANQATVAIENARLFQQEQERATQEQLVRTITDRVRRGVDAKSVMRIALEELSEVLEANISTIQLGTRENLLSKYNRASGELTLQEDSTEDI
jgi:GAF domain-containing protein